ncbi:unnamed protein product [Meloidogyne enterolobii]|uniref:Uncharacterized protein n=1 Tax=Meloidogyne enterolobii TaxID=390850 RepID=A0ACB1AQB3_MELEN
MSHFFNKNNKIDHSFLNNFKGLPFNPPNLNNYKMDIFIASSIGNYSLVEEYILNNKASVNYKNNKGWTPLMYSAQSGNMDVCKLLLKSGANPEEINNEGQNARDLAANWGHQCVVTLMNENLRAILYAKFGDNIQLEDEQNNGE